MQYRTLGRTGVQVSSLVLGAMNFGTIGRTTQDEVTAIIDAALDGGINVIDTADVYGDGRSERIIGRFLRTQPAGSVTVATKMGRRVQQRPEHYHLDNFRAWTDRSRTNLGVDTLDLVQLHCPPTAVFSTQAVYDALDTLVAEGRIANYGVSVETTAEALAAIAHPGVATVQIIFNMLRLKPLDEVLPAAAAAGVGILARVPLASGLLTGRFDENTTFAADDHRTYNRHGEAFDVGETFSGVDYDVALKAVRRLTALLAGRGGSATMAQFALRWIVDHPAVSVVIPGASRPEHGQSNAVAADLAPLDQATHEAVAAVYDELIRPSVHHRW
jgi:aryl-alcohol dehydrogenase-like predicted oxidoreductase